MVVTCGVELWVENVEICIVVFIELVVTVIVNVELCEVFVEFVVRIDVCGFKVLFVCVYSDCVVC